MYDSEVANATRHYDRRETRMRRCCLAIAHSESHVAAGPGTGFESKCMHARQFFTLPTDTATRAVVR